MSSSMYETHQLQLISVNVGMLQPLAPGAKKRSGIHKHPVGGPILCDAAGLLGDAIGNAKYHGGPDQAVYLYSAEDYTWWSERLGRACTAGLFGDNLTIDRWWPGPRIGDRVQFGDVQLELTAPRVPCNTLAERMGDSKFVQRFAAACRPGAYARVLCPGVIESGQSGVVTRGDERWLTVQALFSLWFAPSRDRLSLIETLRAPLARRMRDTINQWMSAGTRRDERPTVHGGKMSDPHHGVASE